MKKFLNTYGIITLNSCALVIGALYAFSQIHDYTLGNIFVIFGVLLLGYIIGSLTCHGHTSQTTVWMTVFVFGLLNLMHSIIDGTVLAGHSTNSQMLTVALHEIARQPILIIILLGLISESNLNKRAKVVTIIVAVPVTWLIGMFLGTDLSTFAKNLDWVHHLLEFGMFIFIGDILHHIKEDFDRIRNKNKCCHT